jgi:hypothetical protein
MYLFFGFAKIGRKARIGIRKLSAIKIVVE